MTRKKRPVENAESIIKWAKMIHQDLLEIKDKINTDEGILLLEEAVEYIGTMLCLVDEHLVLHKTNKIDTSYQHVKCEKES